MNTDNLEPQGNADMAENVPSNKSSKGGAVLAAVVFALAFSIVPWETLWMSSKGVPFVDKSVYIRLFSDTDQVIFYQSFDSIRSFISDEALWNFGIHTLLQMGAELDLIFFLISFVCVFAFACLLSIQAGPWSMCLLINPLIVDLSNSQYRMALASSLLCLGLTFRSRVSGLLVIVLASLLHSAVPLLVACYFACLAVTVLARRDSTPTRLAGVIAVIGIGLAMAYALGPMRQELLLSLEDRRALDGEEMVSSVVYNSFWMLLLSVGLLSGSDVCLRQWNAFAVCVLTAVAAGTFLGVYTSRLLAACFPVLMLFMLSLPPGNRQLVCGMFAGYAGIQWLYWLS